MHFAPESLSALPETAGSFWLVFHGDKLLVTLNKSTVTCFISSWDFHLKPLRKLYLGRLVGFPCYAAEVESEGVILQREVKEEVGIEIKNIRYFGSQSWSFPHSLMIAFTSEYDRGKIEIDQEEIIDAGWFKPDRLPDQIPGTISIARRLIEWFIDNSSRSSHPAPRQTR